MTSPCDVLVYLEDPGAFNYLAGLPAALRRRGARVRLRARGTALNMLRSEENDVQAYGAMTAIEVLRTDRPRMIVVGTAEDPDTPGLALIDAARTIGIPSLGAVDGAANARHRFRGMSSDPLAHAPDRILVPDSGTRARFVELGVQPGRVTVCDHPHFAVVAKRRNRLAALDRSELRTANWPDAASRSMLVFLAETSSGLDAQQYQEGVGYALHGHASSHDRTRIVLDELLDALADVRPRPFLVLRLHPKNDRSEFSEYVRAFDRVSAGQGLEQLLYCADAVVGMTSIALAEAAILGTPTLSIVPREIEREWLPTITLGVTPCATTSDAVRREVALLLARAARGDRQTWSAPTGGLRCILDAVLGSYAR